MSLHLKLLDIDHPRTFEESKLREIEAHSLIYLSAWLFSQSTAISILRTYIFSTEDKKGSETGKHCKQIKKGHKIISF